jgi:hypothetical protein
MGRTAVTDEDVEDALASAWVSSSPLNLHPVNSCQTDFAAMFVWWASRRSPSRALEDCNAPAKSKAKRNGKNGKAKNPKCVKDYFSILSEKRLEVKSAKLQVQTLAESCRHKNMMLLMADDAQKQLDDAYAKFEEAYLADESEEHMGAM